MRLRRLPLFLILTIEISMCGCVLLRPRWPAAPAMPSPPPGAPQFSVVWDQWDYNGMPRNPQWASQRDQHQRPPVPDNESQNECVRRPDTKGKCTVQDAIVDEPKNPLWFVLCSSILAAKIHGHADWMPATYYGEVNWIHIGGDQDYNLRLFPYDGTTAVENGFTTKNNSQGSQQYIEMEFDSQEVENRFKTNTWMAYNVAAQSADPNVMKQWLDPQHGETSPFAVATGLFNLDCEHDCRSELHPLYALAIERDPSPNDNNWAILVRNWGDGGSCSNFDDELTLPNHQFHLLLPNGAGSPTVVLNETEFAVSNPAIAFPQTNYISGTGLLLTFTLPDPGERSLIELSLHLKWPAGKPAPQRPKLPLPSPEIALVAPPEEESAETYLKGLFDKVGGSPALAPGLRMEALGRGQNVNGAITPPAKMKQYRAAKPKPAAAAVLTFAHAVDTEKQQRDEAQFRALCSAYRDKGEKLPTDKIPQLQQMCDAELAK